MTFLDVTVVTAEKSLFNGQAQRVICPGEVGDLEILPNHAPLLGRLSSGQLMVVNGDQEDYYYVSGGIVEVQSYSVIVLADSGERAQDLDEAKAMQAQRRAQEMLSRQQGEINFSEVYKELADALSQIKLIQKMRGKRGY